MGFLRHSNYYAAFYELGKPLNQALTLDCEAHREAARSRGVIDAPDDEGRALLAEYQQPRQRIELLRAREPDQVIRGFGDGFEAFDAGGRDIEARFSGFGVASLCAPSGSASEQRQAGRVRAAAIFKDYRFSDHAPLTPDYDFSL
ncbi:MAG: hypothetical protein U9R74_00240 [Pseudomonadota bacterium]|nr:hypothetical protein [Pseudomonadota bacterium]